MACDWLLQCCSNIHMFNCLSALAGQEPCHQTTVCKHVFFFSNRVRFQRENFQVSKSLWRSPLMTHIYASICHVYHIGVCHIHCQTITIYWWPSVSPNYIIFVLLCFKDDLSLVFTCQTMISHDTDILLLVIKRGNYISQNNFRSRSIDLQFISWIKQSVPRYIFYVPRTGSGDYTNLL